MYYNIPATVKGQIQQEENPAPAMVISVEAARIENAILLDYLTSEVVVEEPEIGFKDPNIPIDINCTDDKLDFVMAGRSSNYEDEGDQGAIHHAISMACWRRWPTTQLEP